MRNKILRLKRSMITMVMALSLVGSMGTASVYAECADMECSETIEDIVSNEGVQVSEDTFVEPNVDISEEEVLGRYVDGENKDWGNEDYIRHRYLGLSKGEKVIVTPDKDMYWDGTNDIEYRVKDYSVAYDPVSNSVYGIMSIPSIDNGVSPTAFVRIPDIEGVELGKEYEAEFMFDIDREIGHGYVEYTVQIIGQRIYLFVIHDYTIASPETEVNADGSITVNKNFIYLLYSMDMNGKDLKLHMRTAYPRYDSTDKKPCWIYYGESPRAIQNIDGKWYALMTMANKKYEKVELSGSDVVDSGISGFLSPSDEWFKLEKRYGEKYLDRGEDGAGTNDTVTTYEQMIYVRQWMLDNGYTQHLYISSYKEAEKEKEKEIKEIDKEREELEKEKEQSTPVDAITVSVDKVFVVKDKINANDYLGTATGKVRYVSSDKKVASVKKSGIITAKKPGNVTITRQVKVGKAWNNVSILTLKISKPTVTLPNNTLEIKAEPNKTYNILDYITNESDVKPTFTVSNSGMTVIGGDPTKIVPVAQGKAVITAKFNSYKLKIKVVVSP